MLAFGIVAASVSLSSLVSLHLWLWHCRYISDTREDAAEVIHASKPPVRGARRSIVDRRSVERKPIE